MPAGMRGDARLGITTPKVYLEHDRTRLWGIGGTIGPTGLRFVGMGEPDNGAYDAMHLDFVLGCAMFMRAQVPQEIGLMDDRFFVFYEEVDFCLRARSAGWEIGMSPEVQLRHFGGETTRDRPDLRTFHLARSRMVFLRKHRDRFEWFPLLLGEVSHFGRMVRWILREGHPSSVLGLLRGTVSGLIGRKIEFMRASGDLSMRTPA
jgi:GT2 family glycosyltransferase